MKILIIHDEQGTIKSFGVPARGNGPQVRLGVKPRAGHRVAEVEAPDLEGNDEQGRPRVRHLRTRYRIDLSSGEPRLLPKENSHAGS